MSGDRFRYRDLPEWGSYEFNGKPNQVKITCGLLGYKGMYEGPEVHYIDSCALADPLLARLPAKYNKKWRVGHYIRHIPQNYQSSIRRNRNLLEDKELGLFLEKMNLISRGDVFSVERFKAILAMNLGQYNHWIDYGKYRNAPKYFVADINEVGKVKRAGTAWNHIDNILLEPEKPLTIDVGNNSLKGDIVELSVDHNDSYSISFMDDDKTLWNQTVYASKKRPGLANYSVPLPKSLDLSLVDAIVVSPIKGDGMYSLGHLIIKESQSKR